MTLGKETCKILKEIRQQIADKNDIEYATSECHYHGECKGTCPKCEAELQYLENELSKRRQLGKAVAVAGISLGIVGSFSACNAPKQENTPIPEQKIAAEIAKIDTTSMDTIPVIPSCTFPHGTMGTVPEITEIVEGEVAIPMKLPMSENIKNEPDLGEIRPNPTWDSITKSYDGERIYDFADTDPIFPGGEEALQKFLKENLVYPEKARELYLEGTTMIQFVVYKDGTVGDVKVLRSSYPILDMEAVRIVKMMPKWIPGKVNERPVSTYYRLPIKFQLEEGQRRMFIKGQIKEID